MPDPSGGSGIWSCWGVYGLQAREAPLDANYRMELQYDGAGLYGWAKQDGLLTVEGCLEEALRTVLGFAPKLRVAGRTDAGVHARRQVVSLELPRQVDAARLKGSLNALTPPGILVTRIGRVPAAFDARRDALSRTYRYFLSAAPVVSPFWSRYCWQVGHDLDLELLVQAAQAVRGNHDFTAFTPAVTEHTHLRRTVRSCLWRRAYGVALGAMRTRPMGSGSARKTGSAVICLEIVADSFLRHMVRALVGTMVEVAGGKRSLDSLVCLLEGAAREGAGLTAPAHGLFLWEIEYGTSRHGGPGD